MSTPAPDEPVARAAFDLREEASITGFLRAQYSDSSLRFSPFDTDARFCAATGDVPGLGVDRLSMTVAYSGTSAEGFRDFVALTVHSGAVQMTQLASSTATTAGGVVLYPTGAPMDFAERGLHATAVRLPEASIRRCAEEIAEGADGARGGAAGEVRFLSMAPVSAAMARYWRALTIAVGGAMSESDSPLAHPLLAEGAARTLATAALHVFPNTTMTTHHVPGPGDMTPATIRRAVAHIEAHAHEPVQLADVAAAAGTSARALQYGFRRHLGTTPLAHLRRVRLEQARRELQQTDPTSGDTVAAVAGRWGFANAGRFAAAYRDAFGEAPGQTLRR